MARLIYVSAPQNFSFSLYPVDASSLGTGNPDTPVTTQTLRLYQVTSMANPTNIFSAGSGADILSNGLKATQFYSNTTKSLRYTTIQSLSTGYYILVASYDTTGVSPIILTY